MGFSLVAANEGYSLAVVGRLLIAWLLLLPGLQGMQSSVAVACVAQQLQLLGIEHWLSNCSINNNYCPWDLPGKNTGVDCHFLLWGDLPNPGVEPESPTLQADSLLLSHQGSPGDGCLNLND